jgi:hypothetical protein
MDSTATAALDLGLVQGPLGSPGGSSRQPNREFWVVWLCGGQLASSACWHYLIINLALNQTGPSYKNKRTSPRKQRGPPGQRIRNPSPFASLLPLTLPLTLLTHSPEGPLVQRWQRGSSGAWGRRRSRGSASWTSCRRGSWRSCAAVPPRCARPPTTRCSRSRRSTSPPGSTAPPGRIQI